ncbi:hypothetical protein [Pseudonocardia hydrocarbonoxydans]|uniref:hypothetical protein n=1 Tax=Pseudonocardia hydrocarbonoxydans TaxID=76726 RepID=UPI001142D219|nr:hypothetical protein [Pseudonocardia hydrocarbonoxydans]
MAKLSTVPAWVRRPLPAVAGVEDFLLRLYRRTESAEALAGFIALSWLGGEAADGPLLWAAPPEERFARAFLAVADALAEGESYPPPEWWRAEAGCLAPMTEAQWNERAGSWPERFYAHGVVCALGWVLGVFDDPAIMAPLHCGDGRSVGYGPREEWRVRLRACAVPLHLRNEEIAEWLRSGAGSQSGPAAVGAARATPSRSTG